MAKMQSEMTNKVIKRGRLSADLSALLMMISRLRVSVHTTSNTREQIRTSTSRSKTPASNTWSVAKLHSRMPVMDLFTLFSIEHLSFSVSKVA